TMRAAPASARRGMPPRGGSPEVGAGASPCHRNPALISMTCFSAKREAQKRKHNIPPETPGAERVREFVNAAAEIADRETWPEPDMRLVEDDCHPAPVLDNDALPAGWEAWITTEAAARGCPSDYVAAALIGAASAWVGNSGRVAATADWIEPAHLWMAL